MQTFTTPAVHQPDDVVDHMTPVVPNFREPGMFLTFCSAVRYACRQRLSGQENFCAAFMTGMAGFATR